jgi:acyl-CoA thioester hydrolase
VAWADFRHRLPLRVRWAEVDMQGGVFNGHYLTYCDVCVTEYWRAIGLRCPEDVVRHGADIFLRKATVEYHAPAVYDDELQVCGRTARLGRSTLRFVVEMYRRDVHEAPLIEAELIYVNGRSGQQAVGVLATVDARADRRLRAVRTGRSSPCQALSTASNSVPGRS